MGGFFVETSFVMREIERKVRETANWAIITGRRGRFRGRWLRRQPPNKNLPVDFLRALIDEQQSWFYFPK